MDGIATPIIGRPRPLPGHDTPNPANNTYTLNYEEPRKLAETSEEVPATAGLSLPCLRGDAAVPPTKGLPVVTHEEGAQG